MPTWKKLVVSGSNISQLVNDLNYVKYGDSTTVLSGSFSGSFYGDGSNITNVTATSIDYTNITNKPTLVSGSTQIDITATDGYSTFSSSIDAHLDANISSVTTNITNVSASFASTQLVQDNRISSLESFSSSLDATYATDIELTNVSSSAHSQRIALISNLSASAATANTNIYNSLSSDITNLSSSAADANNSLSASFASSLSGLSQTLSVSGSTGDADIDLKSQDLSIVGDGGGITTSVSGTTITIDSNGLVSGSSQIDITGTTGYAAFSSSIDNHLDANISAVNTSISNVSSSAHSQRLALYNDLSSDVTNLSSSAHSQRVALYNDLGSDITNLSSSAHSQRTTLISNLSSSVDAHLDANVSALYTSISNLSSSVDAHLDANVSVLNTSISNLSGSSHDQRIALYNLLDSDITNVSSSAHTQRLAISSSFASTIANQGTDVTNLILSQSDFDTAFILSGTDVTVNGNLTVSGTTTYIDSQTIQLGDNIIELTGTGSNFAGLLVNDNSGPQSGSLLWDAVNNYWIAGGEGSETKILLSEGDNVVSSSVQITLGDTTGYTAYSQSVASSITNVSSSAHSQRTALFNSLTNSITNLSSSVDAHLDANVTVLNTSITNLSGSAHLQRIALINALSSSAADANNSLSSSFASTVSGLSQTLTVSGDTGTDGIDLKTETLNVNGDGGGISTAIDASTNTISLVSNGVISGSSQITGDLNVDSINATSITGSSGTITNLYVTTGDVTNLTSTDATVTNLGGTNVNVTNITGSAANITNITNNTFNSVDATITNIGGTNVNVTNITGSAAEITNITVTDGSITNITGTNVNVTNITGSSANITNIGGTSVNVTNITGSSISVGDITTTGDVNIGGDVTTNNFYATSITGSVISGSFVGDGSSLFNITVDQASTISSTFTNVSTKTVTHNFNSRNISVVVYDTDYNMIIPASVNLNSLDQATVTFCSASSGTVVVMKGGHIVSGSISADNIDGLDTAINNYLDLDGVVSSSVQIDIEQTTNYTAFSSSIDTHLDALILALSSSVDTHLDANITNLSSSVDAHLDANISTVNTTINNVSSSIDIAYKAADSALSSSFASTIANLSSTLRISGSTGNDSVNLVNDSLSVIGTAGEIETAVTDNQIQIGIVTNPTLTGNVTVTGNLTIQGDTIQAQVSNLNVEDRFILLNSGSATGDSGIIFGGSDGTSNEGSGIFWDSPSNVFGFASGISSTDVTATHDAKLGYIQQHATAAPSTAPSFQGVGAIHIKEDTGCIYIYA